MYVEEFRQSSLATPTTPTQAPLGRAKWCPPRPDLAGIRLMWMGQCLRTQTVVELA